MHFKSTRPSNTCLFFVWGQRERESTDGMLKYVSGKISKVEAH